MTSLSYATERYLEKLQPTSFDDLVGQTKLTAALERLTRMARRGEQPFPPLLLLGDRGVGKGAIALATGYELAGQDRHAVHRIDADALSAIHSVEEVVPDLDDRDILIVESVEQLEPSVREYLVRAASQRTLNVTADDPSQPTPMADVEPFTLLATATPDISGVGTSGWNPLRVRDYNTEELIAMAHWCADRLKIQMSDSAAFLLARHSYGYARLLRELVVRILLRNVESMSEQGQWCIEDWMVDEIFDADESSP